MNAVDTALSRPYLTIVLAGEACALDVASVVEVVEHAPITRVPRTPDWALGVLNLRGAIVPVVDLARKLGLAPTEVTAKSCVVMVERGEGDERRVVGILADGVDTVVDVDPASIQSCPSFGSRIPSAYVSGLAPASSRLVPLLDVGRALGAPDRPVVS
ncbi:MAG TPA: chemotaxis protein CheW [Thermoanaerobaculia bacterium]|nr:chemotaxis protein CheW [Thermoanaerobaculia bacterium]